MKAKILITGGTGLVGGALSEMLDKNGYEVSHLSRRSSTKSKFKTYQWSIDDRYIDPEALNVDYIVHLAGAGIADKRWTSKRKKIIYDSRILSTRLLVQSLSEKPIKLRGFICASAIGYYGVDSGDELMKEEMPAGSGFVSKVVVDWEGESNKFRDLDIPVANVRTGIVLSEKGGALPRLVQPIRFGVGAPIGSGKQYMSWIHLMDLCRLFLFILDSRKYDTFNAVAPEPVMNATLTRSAAKILKKPLILPNVPGFVLRLVFGEMAGMLLGGNRVSSEKIERAGFKFEFSSVDPCLQNLLG